MKRKYILINDENINLSSGLKWVILIVITYLALSAITAIAKLLSDALHIDYVKVEAILFYIRAFIVLSFIHDFAPKFKKIISIVWSILAAFFYFSIDAKAGDKLYLGALLFVIIIISYNIFIYKKKKI